MSYWKRKAPPKLISSYVPQSADWWAADGKDTWRNRYTNVQSEVRELFAALEDVQFDPLTTTQVADVICPNADNVLRKSVMARISASYRELADYRRPSGKTNNIGQKWLWHCPYYWAAPVEQQCEDL